MEYRSTRTAVEVRTDTSDGITITGYASTFDQPYQFGWYTEVVHRDAFRDTLTTNPDVRLLINHGGLPLARTSSGTLQLRTDQTGLLITATLDPDDPDVRSLVPKLRRGDLNQMSFGFRMDLDSWDGNVRTLRALDLNDGDVSIVTYPANPATSVALRTRRPWKADLSA